MNKRIIVVPLFGVMVSLLLMGFGGVRVLAQGPIPSQVPPTSLPQQFMFNFKVEDVTKFQVTGQGKTIPFTRQPDGAWRADSRENAPYEKNITATLQHLSQLQGGVVVGGATDIQPYGLHAPTIVATMIVSGGVEIPLNVGKPDPDHASYYYAGNFPHTTLIYSIPGTIVDELKGYLKEPAASPTPTKPTPPSLPSPSLTISIPSPSPTVTGAAPTTLTPTLAPSVAPPTHLPIPPPSPAPAPVPTPPSNLVEMLIQRATNNPVLAVGGSGVCLVVLLVFAAFVFWLSRKSGKPVGQGVPGQQISQASSPALPVAPAAPFSPTKQVLVVGTVLQNRYQIVRQLGAGGMGSVYLARHLGLGGKAIAVKENLGGDPRQFQAEAVILANLNHPNLPRVLDHFLELSGAQYLVMDYVEGQDLDSMVRQHGALAEGVALAWMRQILDAVKYLHANHIVHRDIKPQNIIITPQGRAVLVDFGISKFMIIGQPTYTGARAGSPGYAPPEQYTGGTTEHSDIYSLGATLYYLLTGQVPPESPNRAIGVTLFAPRQVNPAISFKTERVILTAMSLPVNQRYNSVGAMERELNQP